MHSRRECLWIKLSLTSDGWKRRIRLIFPLDPMDTEIEKNSWKWRNGQKNRWILFSSIKVKKIVIDGIAWFWYFVYFIEWFWWSFHFNDQNKIYRFLSPLHHKQYHFSDAKCIMSFDFLCPWGRWLQQGTKDSTLVCTMCKTMDDLLKI